MSQTTKKAMAASLLKMLRQKPMNKITVTDIAEDCNVSRMTFYYHFKDIYDLLEWSLNDRAAQILEQCKETDSGQQALSAILSSLQENKVELSNLIRSLQRENVEAYLCKIIHSILGSSLSKQAPQLNAPPENLDFVLNFYTYASAGILLYWIQSGMKTNPQLLADQLVSLCNVDKILNALESLNQSHHDMVLF